MKHFSCLFLIVFFSSMSLFSQEKFRQHTVSKGETISEIAQKYNVKPSAIYELNPDAVNGIKLKSVLLIPTKFQKNTTVSTPAIATNHPEKTHEVLPKETLYGIAKQHHITIEDLYKINPNLEKERLKIGQNIKIPQTALEDFAVANETEKTTEVNKANVSKKNSAKEETFVAPKVDEKKEISTEGIQYEVLPKESLYSIAKKYGIKLADLQKANPELGNKSLKVGQKITVPVKADANLNLVAEQKEVISQKEVATAPQTVVVNKEPEVVKTIPVLPQTTKDNKNSSADVTHEVLAKESFYSIAKQYKITIADLQKANPELGNKSLKVGQKITVPVKAEANSNLVVEKVTEKKEVAPQTVVAKKEPEVAKTIPVLPQTTEDTKNLLINLTHEVLPNESLYSIAKQYKIALTDLKKANPELGKKSLKVGQKINVPVKAEANSSLVAENKDVKSQKEIVVVPQNIEEKNAETELTHEVLPKETKYGIAKQYGLTVAELEKQNPNISKKLLVGSQLKIRTSKLIEKEVAVENAIALEKEFVKEKFENKDPNIVRDASFADQLISKASEHIGTRYRSGGTTTDGFDCSGLMCYTFSSYDIKLPRSSIEMASYGSKIDAQSAQKGDLIFFKTRGSGRINHVGMVVEVLDGEIKFIHSATHGGVIISSTKESYYERNLAQINRVL
ncbi:MAG TPA: LysM peptidoglycan-binding domain-containing protein [Flavobacterium sp.]|nr:LysM peptidoglycan-binding domain-containing protein [Flavobacterium sp.]